eukprot:EG_transcript_38915
MVQLADFSAPSTWYVAAEMRKRQRTGDRRAIPAKPASPTLTSSVCADALPRSAAGRRKRVAFAADSQDAGLDSRSDVRSLYSSDGNLIASEDVQPPTIPHWTVSSFHAGPLFQTTVLACIAGLTVEA